jgi:hypothetical protein
MKTATSLTLVAIGAILAFAVTAQPSFFSFHITGWVLIVIGAAGAVLPRRGYGWLRRRIVLTGSGRRPAVLDRGQGRFWRPDHQIGQGVVRTADTSMSVGAPVVVEAPVEQETVEQETIEQYSEE